MTHAPLVAPCVVEGRRSHDLCAMDGAFVIDAGL